MAKSIRMMLLFDIVYKAVLILGWLSIPLLIKQAGITIFSLTSVAILLMLLGVEQRFLNQWNRIDLSASIRNSLLWQHSFMTKIYARFLFTSSISNSFFVALGFIFYDFLKYKDTFNIGRLAEPVLIGFVVLTFLISAVAQWPAYQTTLDELDKNISAINNDEVFARQMEKEKVRRFWRIIVFGLLFLIGTATLILVVSQFV